jgi:cysteine synthase
VFNVFGDPTPGPRHYENFNSCGFPWTETVDAFVDVPSVESFRMSMRLSREGIIAGPSSGQALKGLLDYLGRMKGMGKLKSLADPETGEMSCVFTCSDLPYQYLSMYFQKLGPEEFPAIQNEVSSMIACCQVPDN